VPDGVSHRFVGEGISPKRGADTELRALNGDGEGIHSQIIEILFGFPQLETDVCGLLGFRFALAPLLAAAALPRVALAGDHPTDVAMPSIVEHRRYTLFGGRRDTLIELFEREFIAPQNVIGAPVLRTFTDLNQPDRFVWLRGSDTMNTRREALPAFYRGPLRKTRRSAANATMRNSNNVLHLHLRTGAFEPRRDVTVYTVDIHYLEPHEIEPFERFYSDVLLPRAKAAGAQSIATLASEASVDNFPPRPVGNETVFVIIGGHPSLVAVADYDARLALDSGWRGSAPARRHSVWSVADAAKMMLLLCRHPCSGPLRTIMAKEHDFNSRIEWTGNRGDGTRSYKGYDRTWQIATPGKPLIQCSNDPLLGGDPTLPNPEDLLLSALSACHMLWYLHLASAAGIVVTAYADDPVGVGESTPDGAGRYVRAVLRPKITVEEGADLQRAEAIHHEIHRVCFIARSVNFPVTYAPEFVFASAQPASN